MKARISMVTLGVGDLGRATSFYRDGLGLPLREESAELAFFDLGGLVLALCPREALAADANVALPVGSGGFALTHHVSSPECVDGVLREAEAAGAEIVRLAAKTSWGGYSGWFADCDGHLWEVAWAPVLADI